MSKMLQVKDLIEVLQSLPADMELSVSQATEWPIDYSSPAVDMTVIRWPAHRRPDLP